MTASLKTDDGGLSSLISLLQEANAGIEQALATLDQRSSALSGAWTGDAAAAYSSAHAQWSAELASMNRLLDDARSAVRRAADRYAHAEAAVAAGWRL